MAEAREAGRNVLLPPPVVSMTFARARTKWYCIALVTAVMVGVAITKIMPPMTFESIGFSSGASAKKPLSDDDALHIVKKYQNGLSFSATRRSNISYGTRDGVCKSPWPGGPKNILPVPPASHIPRLPGSMAFDIVNDLFKGLLAENPTAILGDLAETIEDSIANEINAKKCVARPATVGQFCNFQNFDVPESYGNKLTAVRQDTLAQDAYSRTCNDATGSKLVMGGANLNICPVVMSMIYCSQAFPACSEETWVTNCLNTCLLAIQCASFAGGIKIPVQKCEFEICIFPAPPAPEDHVWQIWKCRTWGQFVACIIIFICCTACIWKASQKVRCRDAAPPAPVEDAVLQATKALIDALLARTPQDIKKALQEAQQAGVDAGIIDKAKHELQKIEKIKEATKALNAALNAEKPQDIKEALQEAQQAGVDPGTIDNAKHELQKIEEGLRKAQATKALNAALKAKKPQDLKGALQEAQQAGVDPGTIDKAKRKLQTNEEVLRKTQQADVDAGIKEADAVKIQTTDSVQWMWGDTGPLGHKIAQVDPLRWSMFKEIDATKSDLENLNDKEKNRPVELRTQRAMSIYCFDTVGKALDALRQADAKTNEGERGHSQR